MLSYTFSRREKSLLLLLVVVLVVIVWFLLVYQRTTNEITRMDSEIAETQSEIIVAQGKVDQMHKMEAAIEKYRSEGVQPRPVPDYDNMTAVMAELNAVLAGTSSYTLSFDELDTKSSNEYVLRGVRANYSCATYDDAEAVVGQLSNGAFPCSIDSVSISEGKSSNKSGGAASASVHITYIERK